MGKGGSSGGRGSSGGEGIGNSGGMGRGRGRGIPGRSGFGWRSFGRSGDTRRKDMGKEHDCDGGVLEVTSNILDVVKVMSKDV